MSEQNTETGKLRVTLRRGLRGCSETQVATVRGLGLKRREQTVEVANTPAFRGMVKKVIHLVDFEEI